MAPRVGVVLFPGTNCEYDALHAVERLGGTAELLWHGATSASGYDALILPGGFAHGDYLRPGAIARAEVTVSNAERTVLPQTAVLTDDRGPYVLIVSAQNKLERRAVHVSGIAGNGVTISDGVKNKEAVVATAGAFLQEGEVVNPVVKDAGA